MTETTKMSEKLVSVRCFDTPAKDLRRGGNCEQVLPFEGNPAQVLPCEGNQTFTLTTKMIESTKTSEKLNSVVPVVEVNTPPAKTLPMEGFSVTAGPLVIQWNTRRPIIKPAPTLFPTPSAELEAYNRYLSKKHARVNTHKPVPANIVWRPEPESVRTIPLTPDRTAKNPVFSVSYRDSLSEDNPEFANLKSTKMRYKHELKTVRMKGICSTGPAHFLVNTSKFDWSNSHVMSFECFTRLIFSQFEKYSIYTDDLDLNNLNTARLTRNLLLMVNHGCFDKHLGRYTTLTAPVTLNMISSLSSLRDQKLTYFATFPQLCKKYIYYYSGGYYNYKGKILFNKRPLDIQSALLMNDSGSYVRASATYNNNANSTQKYVRKQPPQYLAPELPEAQCGMCPLVKPVADDPTTWYHIDSTGECALSPITYEGALHLAGVDLPPFRGASSREAPVHDSVSEPVAQAGSAESDDDDELQAQYEVVEKLVQQSVGPDNLSRLTPSLYDALMKGALDAHPHLVNGVITWQEFKSITRGAFFKAARSISQIKDHEVDETIERALGISFRTHCFSHQDHMFLRGIVMDLCDKGTKMREVEAMLRSASKPFVLVEIHDPVSVRSSSVARLVNDYLFTPLAVFTTKTLPKWIRTKVKDYLASKLGITGSMGLMALAFYNKLKEVALTIKEYCVSFARNAYDYLVVCLATLSKGLFDALSSFESSTLIVNLKRILGITIEGDKIIVQNSPDGVPVERRNEDALVVQAQGADAYGLATIAATIASLVFGTGRSDITDLIGSLAKFNYVKGGIVSVSDTIKSVVEAAHYYVYGDYLFQDNAFTARFRKVMAEANELVTNEQTRQPGSAPTTFECNRFVEVVNELTKLKDDLILNTKIPGPDRTAFTVQLSELMNQLNSLSCIAAYRTKRVKPFSIVITGLAGVGKSSFCRHLSQVCFDEVSRRLPGAYRMDGMYVIDAFREQPYHDGYWNQFCIMIDELNSAVSAEVRALAAALYHQIVDNQPMIFNVAFNRKGKVCCTSPLVVATSNTDFSQMSSATSDSNALVRRCDLVVCAKRDVSKPFNVHDITFEVDASWLAAYTKAGYPSRVVDYIKQHGNVLDTTVVTSMAISVIVERLKEHNGADAKVFPPFGKSELPPFPDAQCFNCATNDHDTIQKISEAYPALYDAFFQHMNSQYVTCPRALQVATALFCDFWSAPVNATQQRNKKAYYNIMWTFAHTPPGDERASLIYDVSSLTNGNSVATFGYDVGQCHAMLVAAYTPLNQFEECRVKNYFTTATDGIVRVSRTVSSLAGMIISVTAAVAICKGIFEYFFASDDYYCQAGSISVNLKEKNTKRAGKGIRLEHTQATRDIAEAQGGNINALKNSVAAGAGMLFYKQNLIGNIQHIDNGTFVLPTHVWRTVVKNEIHITLVLPGVTKNQAYTFEDLPMSGFQVARCEQNPELVYVTSHAIKKPKSIRTHLVPRSALPQSSAIPFMARIVFDPNTRSYEWDHKFSNARYHQKELVIHDRENGDKPVLTEYVTAVGAEGSAFCGRAVIGTIGCNDYFLGVHVAGAGGTAYILPVFHDDFVKFAPITAQVGCIHYADTGCKLMSESGRAYDDLKSYVNVSPVPVDDFVPTVLHSRGDPLHEGGFKYTSGDDFDLSQGCPVAPAKLTKEAKTMALEKTFKNADVIVSPWIQKRVRDRDASFLKGFGLPIARTCEIITPEEAINGNPDKNIPKMDLSTSDKGIVKMLRPGFQKPNLRDVHSQDFLFVKELLLLHFSLMMSGYFYYQCNFLCLKSELRDIARVIANKTRLFNITDFLDNIKLKMIMGSFVAYCHNYYFSIPNRCGISPSSDSWTQFANRLIGIFPSVGVVAGDISGWDTVIKQIYAPVIAQYVAQFYKPHPSYDVVKLINYAIFSCYNGLKFIDDKVYNLCSGNSSGNYLTTFLNSITNYCMFKDIFTYLAEEAGYYDLDFDKCVELHVYSDDNVSKCTYLFWNFSNVQRAFKELFGIDFTAPDKSDDGQEFYDPVDSVEFLSRTTSYQQGYTVSPLKFQSIVGCLFYVHAPAEKRDPEFIREQLQQNLNTARRELMAYDIDQANRFISALMNYLASRDYPITLDLITPDERVQWYSR